MTPHGHRLSNGGLTDSHLPLDAPGGSPHLGYLRRVHDVHNPPTRVKGTLLGLILVFQCGWSGGPRARSKVRIARLTWLDWWRVFLFRLILASFGWVSARASSEP